NVDVQDCGLAADFHGEVLNAIGPRMRGTVAGNNRDIIISAGAKDQHRAAAGAGPDNRDRLDVVPTDTLSGAERVQPALITFRSRFNVKRSRREQCDGVARRGANGIAAVHEYGDRAGTNVEGVVAFQAEDLQGFVVQIRDCALDGQVVAVVYLHGVRGGRGVTRKGEPCRGGVDVERLAQRIADHDQRVL